eukprot:363469-Chlamydomonas_euryale.AAC.9
MPHFHSATLPQRHTSTAPQFPYPQVPYRRRARLPHITLANQPTAPSHGAGRASWPWHRKARLPSRLATGASGASQRRCA